MARSRERWKRPRNCCYGKIGKVLMDIRSRTTSKGERFSLFLLGQARVMLNQELAPLPSAFSPAV